MNFLRGTKEEWNRVNPILEDGQPGYERDFIKDSDGNPIKIKSQKIKIGDGITPWNDLPYLIDKEIIQ